MSFQDFGKSGGASNKTKTNNNSTTGNRGGFSNNNNNNITIATSGEKNNNNNNNTNNEKNTGYNQVSDLVLQYQRNMTTLDNMNRRLNINNKKNANDVLKAQYKVQVDVVQKLGSKIESTLQTLESEMSSSSSSSISRTDAARARATHVKLSRDFRRVEQTFKQIRLDEKKRRVREDDDESRRMAFLVENEDDWEGGGDDDDDDNGMARLKVQLQADRLNEEIMREREAEIRNINKGMHQVNEIYKDLAHIVSSQQEQIDEVEDHMEKANENAEAGLKQVEKANKKKTSGSSSGGGGGVTDPSNCVIS